jgi:hypothetical protein
MHQLDKLGVEIIPCFFCLYLLLAIKKTDNHNNYQPFFCKKSKYFTQLNN